MPCLFHQQHDHLKFFIASLIFVMGAMCFSGPVYAQNTSQFKMQTDGGYRYIASNGVPKAGAPDGLKQQSYIFRAPIQAKREASVTMTSPEIYFGVAMDGVPITNARDLTMDAQGGALQPDGHYVYGAVPSALVVKDLSHVGYAADGFAIFVSKKGVFKPSYNEKKEFVPGLGNLDRCNGAVVNNKYYIYVITPDYPQVPLCWSGKPDESFLVDQTRVSAQPKMPAPSGGDLGLKINRGGTSSSSGGSSGSGEAYRPSYPQSQQKRLIEYNKRNRSHKAYE